MKRLLVAAFAFFVACTSAYAQNPGTVTNHAFAIGKGANVTGYKSLLCGSAQLAVGQAAADPICRTVSGDATFAADGTLTFATVNANVGSFGSSSQCVSVTVNAKGLITAASQTACAPTGITQLTGDVTAGPGSGSQVATLKNTGPGATGPLGSATVAPIVTIDAQGRVTALTSATVTPAIGSVTGLGANCATWLATASSANLRSCMTDESGTGLLYFQGGDAGTPSALVGTNITGTAASFTAGTATNATNVGITNDTTTNATMFPLWVTANTGNLPAKVTSTKLSFNPSTGVLSSTSFTGAGTGLTGTAASLTAGTVTTNANLTGDATSVGNATTVTKINGVDQTTAWATYTPTLSCGTGSGLTTSNNSGQSKTIGKTVFWAAQVAISGTGTCATSLLLTLPFSSLRNINCQGYNATAGIMLAGFNNATNNNVAYTKYDGTNPIAANSYVFSCTYEQL